MIGAWGFCAAVGPLMGGRPSYSKNIQGDLLDPDVLERRAPIKGPNTGSAGNPAVELAKARAARSMGSDTAAALYSLLSALGGRDSTAHRLQEDIRSLQRRIAEAESDKAAKLKEFRDGQFCSGCTLTRSEILAKGEEFPHAGQSVVSATPQQIAAKDAELTAAIDKLRAALADITKKHFEEDRWLWECAQQIEFGVSLWRVAADFEKRAIRAADATRDEHYRDRRDSLLRQIEAAINAVEEGPPINQYPPLVADLELWRGLIQNIVEKRQREALESERQFRDAELNLLRELRGVTAAGAKLLPLKNLGVSTKVQGAMGDLSMSLSVIWGVGGLGRPFRMGNYDPSRSGESVPRVIAFVEDSEAFPPRLAEYDSFNLSGVLNQIDGAISIAKNNLQESSMCDGESNPSFCI
jgi:hypothetical protein